MKIKKSECEKQFFHNNMLNYGMTLFALSLAAVMNVLFAFMLEYFIEAIEYSNRAILKTGLIIVVLYIIAYVSFSILYRHYKNRYLSKALSQLKDYLFSHTLDKSISQFGNETSARFLSAFSSDLNTIEINYLNGTLNLFVMALIFMAAAVTMFIMNWMLAMPVVVVSLVCIAVSLKYGAKLVSKEAETSDENISFIAQVKDLLSGFMVIKSFQAEEEVLELFRKKNISLESTKQNRRETADTVSIYASISAIIVNVIIFAVGVIFAFQGLMTIGKVIAFIQLGRNILSPVGELAPLISNRQAAKALIVRLSNAVDNNPSNKKKDISFDEFRNNIALENVSYSFEKKNAVQGISVKFEKGKSYAIVGDSGSGKSTLVKLLLGHYPDYTGSIKIDEIEMRTINLDDLFQHMSVIQQDVFLFDRSIEENITMFKSFDKQALDDAIFRSGLSALILEKGEGYACGEGGKNLSGGEKQRVSIARCLIRKTPILLMDEATAALDNETALNVENAILNIKNITRIVITHRFSEKVLNRYDEIIVMSKGKIIEQGTFDVLINKKAYFYSLYTILNTE